MAYLIGIVLGYGLGCINPAYLLARIKGFDIRERGSRNAGASNVLITLGKGRGIFCAAFDISKAALAVWLMGVFYPDTDTFAVTASACILGHIFPFYLGFRGGKELACLAGVILSYDLRVFTGLLLFEMAVAILTKYICFIPITASAVLSVIYGLMGGELWGSILLAGVAIIIFCKHWVNLRRISMGCELRLSYLWNRDQEALRIQKNLKDEDEFR